MNQNTQLLKTLLENALCDCAEISALTESTRKNIFLAGIRVDYLFSEYTKLHANDAIVACDEADNASPNESKNQTLANNVHATKLSSNQAGLTQPNLAQSDSIPPSLVNTTSEDDEEELPYDDITPCYAFRIVCPSMDGSKEFLFRAYLQKLELHLKGVINGPLGDLPYARDILDLDLTTKDALNLHMELEELELILAEIDWDQVEVELLAPIENAHQTPNELLDVFANEDEGKYITEGTDINEDPEVSKGTDCVDKNEAEAVKSSEEPKETRRPLTKRATPLAIKAAATPYQILPEAQEAESNPLSEEAVHNFLENFDVNALRKAYPDGVPDLLKLLNTPNQTQSQDSNPSSDDKSNPDIVSSLSCTNDLLKLLGEVSYREPLCLELAQSLNILPKAYAPGDGYRRALTIWLTKPIALKNEGDINAIGFMNAPNLFRVYALKTQATQAPTLASNVGTPLKTTIMFELTPKHWSLTSNYLELITKVSVALREKATTVSVEVPMPSEAGAFFMENFL